MQVSQSRTCVDMGTLSASGVQRAQTMQPTFGAAISSVAFAPAGAAGAVVEFADVNLLIG